MSPIDFIRNMEGPRNPRGLPVPSIRELLLCDKCPACIVGELDTGFECNACGFDAMPLANLFDLDRLKRERATV